MQFEGVVLKEQGVTFAIVIVKPHVLNSSIECENARRSFTPAFPGVPIILMAQDGHRNGAVKQREQVFNPKIEKWVKRGPDGRFMDVKDDGTPFKGVRKEK